MGSHANGQLQLAENPELNTKIKRWLEWDKNEKTRSEIVELVEAKDVKKLSKLLLGNLSFGTAGIRAEMGAGFTRLNDVVLIQLAQGFSNYLLKNCPQAAQHGIVIGCDARHNSKRFSQLTANVFVRAGIKVYLFSNIVPTPLVSFAVTHLGCDAGLMVTASHNPGKDNGYKVYWKNGAQILAPHDTGILAERETCPEPRPESWDLTELSTHPLLTDPLESMWASYLDESAQNYCFYHSNNTKCSLKFTYTPFHGVGGFYAPGLLEKFGFPEECVVRVEEQWDPDPEFPTVRFPNPEEGRPVLMLGMNTADKAGSSILLCSDPDADRFQMAEKQRDGEWRIFTGNEMGGLLAWWMWEGYKRKNPDAVGNNVHMINSTVSSKLMATIARAEGFNYEETLTGFKWMGNRAFQLKRDPNAKVLLAWEESIGYCFADTCLDKDGIVAAGVFAEIANYLSQNKSMTLADQLEALYQKYGYHLNTGSYFISKDQNVTKTIFDRLRNYDLPRNKYPSVCGESYNIKCVRDLTTGYDSSTPDNKPILPVSASSQMITFTLEDGSTITVRASGTEPKIKYYIEVINKPGSGDDETNISFSNAQNQLTALTNTVIEDWIQPEKHGLESKEN